MAVGEVDLYGGQEVASRALHLLFAVSDLVYQTGSSDDPAWDASDRHYEFLDAARTELGVPPRRRPRRDQKPEA